MPNRTWSEQTDNDTSELSLLLDTCARVLVKSPDPAEFLSWIAHAGPSLAPAIAAQVDPRTGPPGLLFRTMGVAIYNAMPQPDAGFRPVKLAVPGRNEPCLCGSGAKYKRCCGPLAGGLDFSTFNLLRYVLENLPQKCFALLPQSRVDPFAVCDTARQWQEEGAADRAVKLLEPWFEGSTTLSDKLELLFEQLMDGYLELGNSRKRERLVAEVLERGDTVLRAVALQRRAMMLADQGEVAEAWNVFSQAQRMDPDNLSLVPLELTLLMSQGDTDRVRDRAQFWLARLERMRDPDLAEMIDFVRAVVADPQAAMSSVEHAQVPGLEALGEMIDAVSAAELRYVVQDMGEGERLLQPSAALLELEQRWREIFPHIKPALTATQILNDEMWDEPEEWLAFLSRNPLAWQSFDVIDDLVLAVDTLQIMVAGTSVLERLLAHGVALLKANLNSTTPGDATLSWAWMENRPALRVLAHQAFRASDLAANGVGSDDFIEPAEMLLALNPNDNHGLRESLSLAYLERGWPEKVITLTDRYPDDFCGPSLNRILALVTLGRETEAGHELMRALEHHDVALKMLLAKNPRAPKANDDFGIAVGSKQEAWLNRMSARPLWEREGGLDWLEKTRKKIRRK
ncbi:MAG: SEC-C metal-binding domain-containing protein [Proteobacteria bacterium]|nr:SEC-C metal-binding domain-containing protein [Pseudomonadota bacterium]